MKKRPTAPVYIPVHRRSISPNKTEDKDNSKAQQQAQSQSPTQEKTIAVSPPSSNTTTPTHNGNSSISSPSAQTSTPQPNTPLTVSISLSLLNSALNDTKVNETSSPSTSQDTKEAKEHKEETKECTKELQELKQVENNKEDEKQVESERTNGTEEKHDKGEEDLEEWEKALEDGALEDSLQSLSIEETKDSKVRTRIVKGRGNQKFDKNETEVHLATDFETHEKPTISSLLSPSTNIPSSPYGGNYTKEPPTDHVLELYGFPSTIKTDDLEDVLEDYRDFGFRIKWVDDNHALAIFRSAQFAKDALKNVTHDVVKLRPFSKATQQSRDVFFKIPSYMSSAQTSPSVRPATTTAVARRLIGNALQIPELQRTKSSDDAINKKIKREKDKDPDYFDS
jgi:hypothetical protein